MATHGPVEASTAASDSANLGLAAWVDQGAAGGVLNSDQSEEYHDASLQVTTGDPSEYLKITNFDFAGLPAGASITQIVVRFWPRSEDVGAVRDQEAKLVKQGTVQADNQATATTWSVGVEKTYTFDVSGDPWTKAQINDATSGFVISAEIVSGSFQDATAGYCTMECTYTAGAAPSTPKQASSLNLGLKGLGF